MRRLLPLLAFGCATTSTPSAPSDPRAAVTAQVQAQYAAVEKADVDAWHAQHAADVIWFGDEAADSLGTKAEVLDLLKKFLAPVVQAKGTIKTQAAPRVLASADGHAAWVNDEDFKLLINVGGKEITQPYRHTELLIDRGGTWTVVMEDWSQAIPDPEAEAMAKEGKLPKPKALADGVAPDAQPIAAVVDGWMANPGGLGAAFSDRPDAYVIGSAPGEHLEGGAAIRERFAKVPPDLKLSREGGLRAGVAGNVGWAAYIMNAQSGELALSFRVQQVFVRENGNWKIVQMHVSHAVPPPQ